MEPPPLLCYTDISSKQNTQTEEYDMKSALTAAIALVVIILVQMALSFAFTYQVGELFGKTAIGALFFYCLLRVGKGERQSSAE